MPTPPNQLRNGPGFATLDRIDRAILGALANNARLSNKELAARLGLAQSSCLERVRRLVRTGALRGFHADIDLGALGIGLEAMVTLGLARHSRATYRALRAHLLGLSEVLALYHVAGGDDFLVHVAARDVTHLREFVVEHIAVRREVARVETHIVFEHVRGRGPLGESEVAAMAPRARRLRAARASG